MNYTTLTPRELEEAILRGDQRAAMEYANRLAERHHGVQPFERQDGANDGR